MRRDVRERQVRREPAALPWRLSILTIGLLAVLSWALIIAIGAAIWWAIAVS